MAPVTQLPRDRWPLPARLGCALALAVATVASWWGWLTAPVPANDDYQAWQVLGCGLTLVVIAIIAPVFVNPGATIIIMTLGLGLGAGVDWVPSDETGTAGVGIIMVVIGTAIGASVIVPVANALWGKSRRSKQRG